MADVEDTAGYGEQDETQVPESEIDTAPADQPIEDESSWGVVTPEQQASADEINGSPQESAQNDWEAERAKTQAEAEAGGGVSSTASTAKDVSDPANFFTNPGSAGNFSGSLFDTATGLAGIDNGFKLQAQQQQTIANQRRQINNGDWRVRLRLAPQANYLYNAPNPGILQPLQVTDGIIFPYTPTIDTAYKANYESYDLTHSNYRGYFYKNSYVDAINLKCTFTAQGTAEANYLLAVIHFLRSATKMFYGQDAQRGAPPPVVYLTGLGEYQFNEHSCLIQSFTYNLPGDVDYIRAGSPNQAGLNLTTQRDRQSVSNNNVFNSITRLANAFLTKGALVDQRPGPPSLALNNPTYVPTKMDINLVLLPIQSRQQVSKQFSVKEFANGNLLKGGFW